MNCFFVRLMIVIALLIQVTPGLAQEYDFSKEKGWAFDLGDDDWNTREDASTGIQEALIQSNDSAYRKGLLNILQHATEEQDLEVQSRAEDIVEAFMEHLLKGVIFDEEVKPTDGAFKEALRLIHLMPGSFFEAARNDLAKRIARLQKIEYQIEYCADGANEDILAHKYDRMVLDQAIFFERVVQVFIGGGHTPDDHMRFFSTLMNGCWSFWYVGLGEDLVRYIMSTGYENLSIIGHEDVPGLWVYHQVVKREILPRLSAGDAQALVDVLHKSGVDTSE